MELGGYEHKVELRKGEQQQHSWRDSVDYFKRKSHGLLDEAIILKTMVGKGFERALADGWTPSLI